MSLVKLAINIAAIMPGFSIRAARTGNPLKYFTSKTHGPVRKHMQRFGLAGLANMEANMRQGAVQDSTKLFGAVIDGAALGQFGRMGGTMLEDIHRNKNIGNTIAKKVLQKTINDNGTFNIPNIEKLLKAGNKAHNVIDPIKKMPLTQIGTLAGAGIGYAKSDNDTKLKSTLKGAIVGGAIGGSARKSIDFAHGLSSNISKAHNEYFKDNYWKTQLEKANSPFYNKVGKHIIANPLTDFAHNRARRIARSEVVQAHADKFWESVENKTNSFTKLMKTDVKDLWRNRQS